MAVPPSGSVGTPPSAASSTRPAARSAAGRAPTATRSAVQGSRLPSARRTARTRPRRRSTLRDPRPQPQIDAALAVTGGKAPSHGGAEDRRERKRKRLDDGHLGARGDRARGGLRAHEPRADHDQPAAPRDVRPQRAGIVERPQVVHVLGDGQAREPARPGPGGEHQAAPAHRLPADARAPGAGIEAIHARAGPQLDVTAGPEPGVAQGQARGRAVPSEQLLRERRALVGRVRLLAGDHDAPAEPPGAERLRAAGAGEAGSHDEHVGGVHP